MWMTDRRDQNSRIVDYRAIRDFILRIHPVHAIALALNNLE